MSELFSALFRGLMLWSSPSRRSFSWSLAWIVVVLMLGRSIERHYRDSWHEVTIWLFCYVANFVMDVVFSSMIIAENSGALHPVQIKFQDKIIGFFMVPKFIVAASSFVCFWIILVKSFMY